MPQLIVGRGLVASIPHGWRHTYVPNWNVGVLSGVFVEELGCVEVILREERVEKDRWAVSLASSFKGIERRVHSEPEYKALASPQARSARGQRRRKIEQILLIRKITTHQVSVDRGAKEASMVKRRSIIVQGGGVDCVLSITAVSHFVLNELDTSTVDCEAQSHATVCGEGERRITVLVEGFHSVV